MSLNWEKKKLEEVCHKIFAGGDKPKDHFSNTKSNFYSIPVVSNGEKNNGISGYTNLPTVSQEAITVSARGTIGFTVHRKYPFVPIVRLIVLIPDQEHISCEYIYYYLKSIDIDRTGTSIPQLTVPMIKKYSIPTPPLSEQKQIVETLDKAFEKIDKAIANVERNIQNAEELLNSKIEELFDSCKEMKLISEMCLKTSNISWKAEGKKEFKYLDLSSVKRNDNKIISHSIVNCDNAPSRAKKIINERDVIFATTRPTLKRAVVIDKSFDKSLCSTGFVVLRSNGDVSPEWIYNFLFTKKFLSRMEKLQRGASYPAVSDSDVKKTKIPLPINSSKELLLLDELKKVRVGLKSLKHDYNYKINSLKELKKSILEKAFKGELTSAA